MKVLYFAWVRERIGAASEEVETEAATVADVEALGALRAAAASDSITGYAL